MSIEDRSMKVVSFLIPGLAVFVILALVVIPACMDSYMEFVGEIAFGPNDPPGPLLNPNDWPRPLQDLQQELGGGTKIDGFLLYGAPGEYSVKDAVFRIETPPSLLNQIVGRLELVHVEANQQQLRGLGDLIVSKAGKEWWPSAPRSDVDSVDYYYSQRRLDGEEGDLYIAAYDKVDETLYLHFEYNF